MAAPPPRTRLIVVDPSPRRRLAAVAALSSRFDVHALGPDDDPLRAARARRPDLVLFALDRDPDQTLRFVRTLRTDVRPIERVAVYVDGRPPRPADAVCGTWCADGYLADRFDGPDLLAFVDAVLRGERPIRVGDASGVLGRVFGRLRRG